MTSDDVKTWLIKFANFCVKNKCNKSKTNILAVLRFKIPFERNAFRFNPFDALRETTFKQARNLSLGALC